MAASKISLNFTASLPGTLFWPLRRIAPAASRLLHCQPPASRQLENYHYVAGRNGHLTARMSSIAAAYAKNILSRLGSQEKQGYDGAI
jgi:hypothetical protein